MSRPLQIEFEHAVYHVTARGNARRAAFRDDKDRTRFLETLAEAVLRFGVVAHAHCLMPNHHQLLLQTPRANLSRMMGWRRTTYTVRFNRFRQQRRASRGGASGTRDPYRCVPESPPGNAETGDYVKCQELTPLTPLTANALALQVVRDG
jgi:REP element-mobilizing transposase RayT